MAKLNTINKGIFWITVNEQLDIEAFYPESSAELIHADSTKFAAKNVLAALNEIVDKISKINNEILDYKQQENKLIEFIKVVSNYNQIEELNIKILNEFINKIIIHERDIINGKRYQKMTIIYKYMPMDL